MELKMVDRRRKECCLVTETQVLFLTIKMTFICKCLSKVKRVLGTSQIRKINRASKKLTL